MKIADIKDMVTGSHYVVTNKILIHNLTNDGALIYIEFVQRAYNYGKKDMLTGDGYFFCTVEDLEYECSVSASKQQRIIKSLVSRGLIAVDYRGMPKRRYIKVLENSQAVVDAFKDTREMPETIPMPEDVKRKYVKSFDMDILKKQIKKASRELGIRDEKVSDNLHNMYGSLFEKVGYPYSALSTKSVKNCLSSLQKLDPEYKVTEHFKDYLDVYVTLPCKKGHDLGMSNLLTEEMLDVIRTRMVCEPDTEVVFDF